ncbi:MAG: bifunctional lysine ketoglutarate reductase /saccharopine dehydrogenase family protein [Bacteroidota bacterium]|nr:bifunctional lysine ketoglutarate reductase /saccharopine dehydrogenase family protein [Bacteroidota bacterium]
MSICIGIRREDKYKFEKRVALTPEYIDYLKNKYGYDFIVQPSNNRIFKDEEFIKSGARIQDDLSECKVIFGVKEMPVKFFEEDKTYVFFSHTIKCQPYNMPMLMKMMDLKCNLIDYEKIVDEEGRRLIFFGKYAGYAGTINTLWSLGLRLNHKGIKTPFLKLKQTHNYNSLEEARKVMSELGQEIIEKGLPKELCPFVIGITGYGNVSCGAQDILNLLPTKEISPEELLELKGREDLPNNIIYRVIFKEKDISVRRDGKEFVLEDYYKNPSLFKNNFRQYVPQLSVLLNCMYWTKEYPRIISKAFLSEIFSNGEPKLQAIGDISCDVNGSVECTVEATEIENPIYVYNPSEEDVTYGYEGEGMLVMAVDILPSELPREASESFSKVLINFLKPIAEADYKVNFNDLQLPMSLKNGMILHKGELTPSYKYIENCLDQVISRK